MRDRAAACGWRRWCCAVNAFIRLVLCALTLVHEGIGGYGQFRDDLVVMYFVDMELASGRLVALDMTPRRIEHFRLNRASKEDALWLKEVFTREGSRFGTQVEWRADNTRSLAWI